VRANFLRSIDKELRFCIDTLYGWVMMQAPPWRAIAAALLLFASSVLILNPPAEFAEVLPVDVPARFGRITSVDP
jgi:hypothetical protein